jgi:uncharacterized protein YdeI (YjbR/CyaY-like superfamily)
VPDEAVLIVADRSSWRRWLMRGGAESMGVWLVLAKGGATQPTRLTYDEALEEALCFGWIDGQLRGRDEQSFMRRFTPRRRRSTWSQRNVEIVERLRLEGRMTAAGEAAVAQAQRDGAWARAYPRASDIEVPSDLAAALTAEPRAASMFAILTSANRFAILYRVQDARTPVTRARRIDEFVRMLAQGQTPHPQRRTLES